MFALTNYFTLTSKNITVWWQNKSSGLVVFKKRNGSTNLIFGNIEVKQKKELQKLDAVALGSGNGVERATV